ncbi:MAG: NirD/YgiW/YdeI family stress tolerance protein [Campylobacter sp.]|nr:NirD/YgiW/YdeI family stress tolerance protein [Campylobacter sp.]
MIKKFMISVALAGVVFAQGGFVDDASKSKNPSYDTISVAKAKTLADDTKVTLEGKILRSLGDEKYEFVDANGDSIIIEIDDKDFRGQTIDKNTKIRIKGEIDKDANGVEIDTEWLEIAIVEW